MSTDSTQMVNDPIYGADGVGSWN